MNEHNPYAPPTSAPAALVPLEKITTFAARVVIGVGVFLLVSSVLWGGISIAGYGSLTTKGNLAQNVAWGFCAFSTGLPLAAGIGLVLRRRWGWLLGVAYFGLTLLLVSLAEASTHLVVSSVKSGPRTFEDRFFLLILVSSFVGLVLLLLPAVRKHFVRGAGAGSALGGRRGST